MSGELYVGLDVGTQGARVVACDAAGRVVAEASFPFAHTPREPKPGWHEQQPEDWWHAAVKCLQAVATQAEAAGHPREALARIAVTSTSGTVLLVASDGRPLMPAVMYSDSRASAEAERVNAAAGVFIEKTGSRFSASFALPKLLWLAAHRPKRFEAAARICHAADFLVGRLTGHYDVSDTSNVLKTGYDIGEGRWPAFFRDFDLPLAKLPRVVRPGEPVGRVSPEAAERTGLSRLAIVVAGATDGTAGFLASGACQVGQWCSTLGTTLVLRGVSRTRLRDPLGRVYCHAHPDGHWLPGAASNVGGECLEVRFKGRDLAALDAKVADHVPNDLILYPLVRRGERFPFVDPEAEGFVRGKASSRGELYAACLEAVAFVERWGFDILAGLGAPIAEPLFASGGAVGSAVWLQLRANVLGRPIRVAADAHSAKGAAILAAASAVGSLAEAVRRMVRFDRTVEPHFRQRAYCDDKYARFRNACAERYPAARA
ncbi:MAG TPA: FGGY-family carbohydrate kinase [Planctomycetota bacterium]|nr:FGGY-family carbohydrate kinase [Planctomycetota bacterium]